MAQRERMGQSASEGYFRRTAATHPKNYAPVSTLPYRGGIRL